MRIRMAEDAPDTASVLKILKHPVRRRILEILSDAGPLTWKQLSMELGTGTGTLYHHLDMLEFLVRRDSRNRFALTKRGEYIQLYLTMNPSIDPEGLSKALRQRSAKDILFGIFLPRSLIASLTLSKFRSVVSTLSISVLVIVAMAVSGEMLILFSFYPSTSYPLMVFSYSASVLILAGIAYVVSRVIFSERPHPSILIMSTALSFVPLGALSLALNALSRAGFISIFSSRSGLTILFSFFQAWGAGIISGGMSVATGLRIEKTLLVSLIVLYATMIIVLMQGGPIG